MSAMTSTGMRSTTTIGSASLESSIPIMGNSYSGSNNGNMNLHLNQQQMISQTQNAGVVGIGANSSGIMAGNIPEMQSAQSMIGLNNTGYMTGNNFSTGPNINPTNNQMYFHQMSNSVLSDNMMNSGNVHMSPHMSHPSANSLNLPTASYQAQLLRQQHVMKMAANQQQQQQNFNS